MTIPASSAAFRLYSRPGCHLCEQMLEQLLPLIRGKATVEVVDIDSRAEWRAAFDIRIPVLEYEGREVAEITLDTAVINSIVAGIS